MNNPRPPWPGEILALIDRATARGRELIALVDRQLPLEVGDDHEHDSWEVTGPALVVRGRNTLEALLALTPLHRRIDAAVLLRSGFEHFVTFAWLAFDPEHRMAQWMASDAAQRLKTDNDFVSLGEPILDENVRADMEARAAAPRMPTLPERAADVDSEWGSQLSELASVSPHATARGIYRTVYREGSAFTHPTIYGIEPIVDGSGDPVVVDSGERVGDYAGSLVLGPTTYALELFVAGAALGWPAASDVHGIFERHPDPAVGG